MTINNTRYLELNKKSKMPNKTRSTSNAVIYTRVSSKEQAETNASLETQKKYCQEYARKKNLNIIEYFGGTYESAKSDERKEFKKLLAFVKRNKKVSYIIVYAYDRFSRTGANGAYISNQLTKAGIKVVAVTQELDPSTPSGQLQQQIYFAFSQHDNMLRRQRMISGMIEKLEQGYWPLMLPLGYTNLRKGEKANNHKIVIDLKGKKLKKAWNWKIKYNLSNKEIVKRLNGMNVKISERKLSQTFRNPFYCGKIVCSFIPDKVIDAKHEALVSEKDFFMVLDILNGKFEKSKHSSSISSSLPLRRYVYCSDCGEPITGYHMRKKDIFYYKCRTKGCCKNLSQKKMHSHFMELLGRFEIIPNSIDHFKKVMLFVLAKSNEQIEKDISKYRMKRNEIKGKVDQLEERFIEGEVNKSLYDKYNHKFQQEIQELEQIIGKSSLNISNLENYVQKALDICTNLSDSWMFADVERKETIQKLMFPDGITYNWENHAFRTPRINSLFALIPEISRVSDQKKTGSIENFSFDPVKSG